jgi:hypothetical protein
MRKTCSKTAKKTSKKVAQYSAQKHSNLRNCAAARRRAEICPRLKAPPSGSRSRSRRQKPARPRQSIAASQLSGWPGPPAPPENQANTDGEAPRALPPHPPPHPPRIRRTQMEKRRGLCPRTHPRTPRESGAHRRRSAEGSAPAPPENLSRGKQVAARVRKFGHM